MLMLKAERLRQGLSTTALAKRIGINRSTVTHVETDRNRPGFWLLLKMAEGLNQDLADLIKKARLKKSE